MNYPMLAYKLWDRYKRQQFPPVYTTILTYYGAFRMAEVMDDGILLEEVKEKLHPFWNGKIAAVAGYYGKYDYRWGGNASAWALLHDYLPEEAKGKICAACDDLLTLQPRYENKIFCRPKWYEPSQMGFRWIDSVFGVCPFLLWTGLKCGRQNYIDEAAAQMRYHHELLFDPVRKLYHQCMDASRPELTPGYWSRGVGWGLHALADLSAGLPSGHPEYDYIRQAYQDAIDGCVDSQDPAGMWHQSMDDFGTYPETSGTGLILYALGKGIRNGFFTSVKYLETFKRGLRGLTGYIGLDGSVHNCCCGCCSPGYNGTAADYQMRGWVLNDNHAFGPPILACTEAIELQKKGVLKDGE